MTAATPPATDDAEADPHRRFMHRAIELAREGMDKGAGGPFGCVIVKDGVIVGEGHNEVVAGCDPTAHAEVVAIRRAARELGAFHLEGCTVYTSCEPCPMCLAALYWAHVERIFYAADKQDAATAGFDDAFLYQELPRPMEARSIPFERLLAEDSRKVFESYMALEGRIPY